MTAIELESGHALSPEKTLRKLFLRLFLRGRSARGIGKSAQSGVPTSIARKLGTVLAFYALFGIMSLTLVHQAAFVVGLYLHVMTFVLVGLFVASSAGEVLFNKEEADILLHRPIAPRTLLWAKISVMVQVSLWLAGAFNLVGLVVGAFAVDGGWLFPVVHAVSMSFEAIFVTALVVVSYQLCLRWFGRERLDAVMTATQVLASIVIVVGGQLVPQLMIRFEGTSLIRVNHWWVGLLPPSWFAGMDDALAGSGAAQSWWLALVGIVATSAMTWLAFVRLANDYQSGLQVMGEMSSRGRPGKQRQLLRRLVQLPPLSWWLRDSASRASFLLSVAYLARDRETKLRVFPGLAPMLIMPVIMLLPRVGSNPSAAGTGVGAFGVAFAGGYVGLLPLVALGMLGFSQQWQAADIFRVAPVSGPAPFCHGARRAVLLVIAMPMLVLLIGLLLLMGRSVSQLVLFLPGLLALPLYAMYPCLEGKAVPFSRPPDESNAAGRSGRMIAVMISSALLAGLVAISDRFHWFGKLLLVELIVVIVIYVLMRRAVSTVVWSSIE